MDKQYKVVPVEATEEMAIAASQVGYPLTYQNVQRVWKAMVAAAPTQPSPKVIAYRALQSETGNPLTDWIDGAPDGEPALSSSKYQLAYAQPSPAEADKEAVRNAALEEAAEALDMEGHSGLADTIRVLKSTSASEVSQPAQLSGNSGELPEPSDGTD